MSEAIEMRHVSEKKETNLLYQFKFSVDYVRNDDQIM